jgi:hypothetical protein
MMMTDTLQNPEECLPLTPAVFNILLALAEGEKHGYGIMLEVEANTKGQVIMGPGTLFGSIKRMLKAELIERSDERAGPEMDDQRRPNSDRNMVQKCCRPMCWRKHLQLPRRSSF